jgi:hypothetical protein
VTRYHVHPILRSRMANFVAAHHYAVRVPPHCLLSLGCFKGSDLVADADNGYPWQASIGAAVREVEFVGEGRMVTVNGREFAGPVNAARRAALQEVSFVGNGADDQTSASIAAGAPRRPPSPPVAYQPHVLPSP